MIEKYQNLFITSISILLQMNSAIVPTKVLTDPTELERILQSGLQASIGQYQGNAASNGYSFDPSTGFGTEGYQVSEVLQYI